jgi:integrase
VKRLEIKRRPLSDTALANLEPESVEYREHDGGGLYFRVKPSGAKSWTLRYKAPTGKWRWLGLGSYPAVSAAMARKRAAELREEAYHGSDISQTARRRQEELEAAEQLTFKKLAEEWHSSRRAGWTEGTSKRIHNALKRHVYPKLGNRPFASIHPMEWMDLLRSMEDQKIIEQMRNVRRCCKEIYDLARVTGRITHNPLDGLSRFLKTRPAENYAHVKIQELPSLLRAIDSGSSSKEVQIGLKLLILTATRPSEVREATWEEFDFKQARWTIPAERMKKRREHVVPLSRQAMEILQELRQLTGAYRLLFPGRSDRTKPRSNMVFNMALRRLGYGGQQTGHGFRHIASTILRENGFHRDYVEAQLSHVEEGVSGVYNKATYLPQRREMMQWYADHLDQLAAKASTHCDHHEPVVSLPA